MDMVSIIIDFFFFFLALIFFFEFEFELLQIVDASALPKSKFSCEGKVIGGYYADVESGCQMFHVCTLGQKSA